MTLFGSVPEAEPLFCSALWDNMNIASRLGAHPIGWLGEINCRRNYFYKEGSIMRRLLLIAGSVVLSFLLGYGIVYLEKREVEQTAETDRQVLRTQLSATEAKFQIASVTNQLGVVLIAVNRNNFGNASELATRFFDDLTDLSHSMPDTPERDRLTQVLQRRDEIIADLAMLKPETASKLQSIYLELVSATPVE